MSVVISELAARGLSSSSILLADVVTSCVCVSLGVSALFPDKFLFSSWRRLSLVQGLFIVKVQFFACDLFVHVILSVLLSCQF